MCLMVVHFQPGPQGRTLVVANRDEWRARPTAPLAVWTDPPMAAGRDLQAGGTWMGWGSGGIWGGLTNIYGGSPAPGAPSRGGLIPTWIASGGQLDALPDLRLYAGVNLLLGDGHYLYYRSNRHPGQRLDGGLYALSNASLDTPWPKLVLARESAERLLPEPFNPEAWLAWGEQRGPEEGLGSIFVDLPEYGTRSTTVALSDRLGWQIWERRHDQPSQTTYVRYSE